MASNGLPSSWCLVELGNQQVEAANLDAAIAANLKGLGHG